MSEALRLLRMVGEGLSSIVFHYTMFSKLCTILQSNEFRLVSAVQTGYYFCVARSHMGEYSGVHSGAVEIVLDGNKLAQHYQAAPVNYWGDGFAKDEMEDRIYSKTPTIPNAISYMKEIHLLWSVRRDEDFPYPRFSRELQNSGIGKDADMLRQCWLIAKQHGVPF